MEDRDGKRKLPLKDLGWILAPIGALILVVGLIAGGITHMPEIAQTISASGALMLLIGALLLRSQIRKRKREEKKSEGNGKA